MLTSGHRTDKLAPSLHCVLPYQVSIIMLVQSATSQHCGDGHSVPEQEQAVMLREIATYTHAV